MTPSPPRARDEVSTQQQLSCELELRYDWSYDSTQPELRDLYRKAQRGQWLPDEILPWQLEVDLEQAAFPAPLFPLFGSELYDRLIHQEKRQLDVELSSWLISQFLHGEQGALLAASQLVATAPALDAKLCASTQVVDEARHVEVYDRYLREKVGFSYPISPHLKRLLDLILTDCRWDMKLLGMQIVVEGMALASFGLIREHTTEPLLKQLTHYVMLDEARHVAYGVLSLRDLYADMSEAERNEREDFLYEAAVLARDRFLFDQIWEKMGLPVAECVRISRESEPQRMFRQLLFSKIVPAIKKMGLLSPRQRARFEQLGILQFESWADPFEELLAPQPKVA